MKSLSLIVFGMAISIFINACSAMGGKSISYSQLPNRSSDNSVWTKCLDGDYRNVCKYTCVKYQRNNTCKIKNRRIEKLDIAKALNHGFVFISKAHFLKLIGTK